MSVNLNLDINSESNRCPSISTITDGFMNRRFAKKNRAETLSVSEPPSYDQIVNQEEIEKTQRKIWGSFFLYLSHFCGVHTIRAPYYCSTTECKNLR